MTKQEIEKLAREIATELFTVSASQNGILGDELRIYDDGRYLGGWSIGPASDLIARHLTKKLKKRKKK